MDGALVEVRLLALIITTKIPLVQVRAQVSLLQLDLHLLLLEVKLPDLFCRHLRGTVLLVSNRALVSRVDI